MVRNIYRPGVIALNCQINFQTKITHFELDNQVVDLITRQPSYRFNNCKNVPAGIAQLVERQALGCKVLSSNLASTNILEVTLGGHSNSSLTIPKCKIGTRSRLGNSELTLRIQYFL